MTKPIGDAWSGDLTGTHIGSLSVLRRLDRVSRDRQWLYECACDCGRHVVRPSGPLRTAARRGTGQYCSINCQTRKATYPSLPVGARVGHLTVVSEPARAKGGRDCACVCDCGRRIRRAMNALLHAARNGISSCCSSQCPLRLQRVGVHITGTDADTRGGDIDIDLGDYAGYIADCRACARPARGGAA